MLRKKSARGMFATRAGEESEQTIYLTFIAPGTAPCVPTILLLLALT
jgi:hypothetical protein